MLQMENNKRIWIVQTAVREHNHFNGLCWRNIYQHLHIEIILIVWISSIVMLCRWTSSRIRNHMQAHRHYSRAWADIHSRLVRSPISLVFALWPISVVCIYGGSIFILAIISRFYVSIRRARVLDHVECKQLCVFQEYSLFFHTEECALCSTRTV